MYYRVPLQTKNMANIITFCTGGGKLSNPYFVYIKKVFNWIGELSEEVHVSKTRLFFDYVGSVLMHGCLIRQYRIGGFWAKSYAMRKKCLTYPRMVKMMKKLNNPEYIHYLNEKVDFNQYFKDFVHRDWIYIKNETEEDFENFVKKYGRVIIKPVAGVEGGGVRKLRYNEHPEINLKQLYADLLKEDVMVEEIIKQHPKMVFGNTSVNTIRTMTITDKSGKGHVVKAILRAGVGDTDVDNYAEGGSIYEVDLETGVVCSRGKSKAGDNHIKHPGTDIVMLGYQIPNWDKVMEASRKAAEHLPQVGIIGWDVAITESGTDMIEGNHNPDYELYEYLGSTGYYEVFNNIIK